MALLAPLVAYPNPQPRPHPDNAAAYAAWDPVLWIQRHGDMMKLMTLQKILPIPVKFGVDCEQLMRQCKTSAAEIAHICRKNKCLRWGDVEGGFDSNLFWQNDGEFQNQLGQLLQRIKWQYPPKTD